jgi:integrase
VNVNVGHRRRTNEIGLGSAAAAGITDLHFHDIRGTTVTMLAEAGCTLPEIASITGHTLRLAQDTLDKYLARTSKLAASAIAKFENVIETESAKRLAK